MTNILGRRSVYAYRFPECRKVMQMVDTVLNDDRFYLNITPATTAQEILAPLQLSPEFALPSYPDGLLDLDSLYKPVTSYLVQAYKEVIPGLETFPYRFCTQGSSEGIQKSIAELANKGVRKIYTLLGEYEGYKYAALGLGIDPIEVDLSLTDPSLLEPGHWFISNPSAVNGNILPEEFMLRIYQTHQVHLDLAYVGSTRPHVFPVYHPNILEAYVSLSKPDGMFRERIGAWFGREMLSLMSGNLWFYSTRGAILAVALISKLGLHSLYRKYRVVQEQIIADIYRETGIHLHASDALLLANLSETEAIQLSPEQRELLAEFKRGKGYRICLTPRFELAEQR